MYKNQKIYNLSKMPKKVIETFGADCAIYLNFLLQSLDTTTLLNIDILSKLYPNITPENLPDYQGIMITRLDIMATIGYNVKRQQRMFDKIAKYGFFKKVLTRRPATCLYVFDIKKFEEFCGQNLDHFFDPKNADRKEKRKVPKEKRKDIEKNIIFKRFFDTEGIDENEKKTLGEFFSLIPESRAQEFYEFVKTNFSHVKPEECISKFCKYNEHKRFDLYQWTTYLLTFCTNCRTTPDYKPKFTEHGKQFETLCITLTEAYQRHRICKIAVDKQADTVRQAELRAQQFRAESKQKLYAELGIPLCNA